MKQRGREGLPETAEQEMALELELRRLTEAVLPPDGDAMEAARQRQARLAKPPGSLGRLEELSVRLAGITGKLKNRLDPRELLVFAADNGVVAEGVAVAPRRVTAIQTRNLVRGRTGAAVLCRRFGVRLTVCDVGVGEVLEEPGVLDRKLAFGTGNIAQGPAMSRTLALKALLTGAALARKTDAEAVGVGEMGIGNTTTSAAVLCALLGVEPAAAVGRGGGLTDEGLARKRAAVARALEVNRPDPADPVGVLAKVGGLDLAAMCGAFLGAAAARRPAVLDGLISTVAALCAVRLCPGALAYLIPGHGGREPGQRLALAALGPELRPLLELDLRLGEGSGCPLVFSLLDAACAVMEDMAEFGEAGIDDGYLEPVRSLGEQAWAPSS